jgi:hypothetical protein
VNYYLNLHLKMGICQEQAVKGFKGGGDVRG